MINIRLGVFETNSSSTHSIAIMNKDEWEKVKAGKLFINIAAHWYDGKDAPAGFTKYPELVTEEVLLAEAKKEYLREERHNPDCHNDFHDGHYVSWEEIMERCDGNYGGYDLNLFGWAGETYINPKSGVWHSEKVEDLPDGKVKVEFEHFFG
jgi:hypothetical protein